MSHFGSEMVPDCFEIYAHRFRVDGVATERRGLLGDLLLQFRSQAAVHVLDLLRNEAAQLQKVLLRPADRLLGRIGALQLRIERAAKVLLNQRAVLLGRRLRPHGWLRRSRRIDGGQLLLQHAQQFAPALVGVLLPVDAILAGLRELRKGQMQAVQQHDRIHRHRAVHLGEHRLQGVDDTAGRRGAREVHQAGFLAKVAHRIAELRHGAQTLHGGVHVARIAEIRHARRQFEGGGELRLVHVLDEFRNLDGHGGQFVFGAEQQNDGALRIEQIVRLEHNERT